MIIKQKCCDCKKVKLPLCVSIYDKKTRCIKCNNLFSNKIIKPIKS